MLRLLPLLFFAQFDDSWSWSWDWTSDWTYQLDLSWSYDDSCKSTANEFQGTECGSADPIVCCLPIQACVTAKDSTGDNDVAVCSEERRLWGEKAVHIVMVPFVGSLVTIVMAIYSFKGMLSAPMQGAGKAVATVSLITALISWPLYLSVHWQMGVYSFFLSLLTISSVQWTDRVWWLYRLVWIMQIFQIIAFFGAYEPFHVPFFRFHRDDQSSGSMPPFTALAVASKSFCAEYYGNYFKLLDIERNAHKANPNMEFFGLCTDDWLGCIHLDIIMVGILWMVICALSTPILMSAEPGKVARMSIAQAAGMSSGGEIDDHHGDITGTVPIEIKMEENNQSEADGEQAKLVGKPSD